MGKHKKVCQDESRMEKNFIGLDKIGNNCIQIKRDRSLRLISISLFSSSLILSFKLLINLLFPNMSFGDYELTIIITSSLTVNIVASLILYKYQSLHENLLDNLNNFIDQFKMGNVEGLLLDTVGSVLKANKKMERLLGSSEEERLTMNLIHVVPKDGLEPSQATVGKLFQTGKSDQANDRIIKKDNHKVPVNFAASKVEYRDKTSIQGIFRDLTESGRPDAIQVQQYRDHLSFLQNFFKIPTHD
jgi:PAS domain S-box-containing protein